MGGGVPVNWGACPSPAPVGAEALCLGAQLPSGWLPQDGVPPQPGGGALGSQGGGTAPRCLGPCCGNCPPPELHGGGGKGNDGPVCGGPPGVPFPLFPPLPVPRFPEFELLEAEGGGAAARGGAPPTAAPVLWSPGLPVWADPCPEEGAPPPPPFSGCPPLESLPSPWAPPGCCPPGGPKQLLQPCWPGNCTPPPKERGAPSVGAGAEAPELLPIDWGKLPREGREPGPSQLPPPHG